MSGKKVFATNLILAGWLITYGCNILGTGSESTCQPEFVCTNAVSDEWTYLGLEGEAIGSILIDYCNPYVIIAGSRNNFTEGRTGKIFRSENCGKTWKQTYIGGSFRGFTQDPNNPSVIYAWDSTPNGDILQSRDNGKSWSIITQDLKPTGIDRAGPLIVNPNNSNHLIANKTYSFMSGRLYQSFNGGQTWSPISDDWDALVSSGTATVLYVHPENPNLFFAGMYPSGRILRSEDAGKNWQITEENYGVFQNITTVPGHPNMLYAITSTITRPDYKGPVFISEDWGKNWTDKPAVDTLHRGYNDIVSIGKNEVLIASWDGVVLQNEQDTTWINDGFVYDAGFTPGIMSIIQPKTDFRVVYAGMDYSEHLSIIAGYKGGIYVRRIE